MSETVNLGLEKVQQAVETRAAISERYEQYNKLSAIVQTAALVDHAAFKNACDALYYLGGGWPTENSKGRMEKACENMAGMYKILSLIGDGHLIEDHMASLGVDIVLRNPIPDVDLSEGDIRLLNEEFGMNAFRFQTPEKLSHLVRLCVDHAQDLQRFICQNADLIKDELKPAAMAALQIEREEYDRVIFLTKNAASPAKAVKKKNKIQGSVSNFTQIARTNL